MKPTEPVVALRRARVPGATGLVDLAIADGTLSSIEPSTPSSSTIGPEDVGVLDVGGRVVLPGLVDAHVHLDKAYLLDELDAAGLPRTDLVDAIASTAVVRASLPREVVADKAERALAAVVAAGTTALRAHVELEPDLDLDLDIDIDIDKGLRPVAMHVELARRWQGRVDVQLVAFPQHGITQRPGTRELLDAALGLGCAVVGGCPYVDPDPVAHIDAVFALSQHWQCPVDFHLDFSNDAAAADVDTVIDRTSALGMGGQVLVGHLTSLASAPPDLVERRIERLAGAGVAAVSLPVTDLYLMGSLTPLTRLLAGGVPVALGSNNLRNAFSPFGSGSLLQAAWLAGVAGRFSSASAPATLLDAVTATPARMLGLPAGTGRIRAGGPADFVVVDGSDVADAVLGARPVVATVKGGHLVWPSSWPQSGPRDTEAPTD